MTAQRARSVSAGKADTYGGQPGRADNASVRSWPHTDPVEVSADPADVESVTSRYLMNALLPAWFVPGVADYDLAHATRTMD
jgi:hypothetical protein